jgi:hypothetical protein
MCEWGGNYCNIWLCACRSVLCSFCILPEPWPQKAVPHQAKRSSGSYHHICIIMVLWVIIYWCVGLCLVSVDKTGSFCVSGWAAWFVFGAMSLRSVICSIQELRGGLWFTVLFSWADATSGKLVPHWCAYLAAAFARRCCVWVLDSLIHLESAIVYWSSMTGQESNGWLFMINLHWWHSYLWCVAHFVSLFCGGVVIFSFDEGLGIHNFIHTCSIWTRTVIKS